MRRILSVSVSVSKQLLACPARSMSQSHGPKIGFIGLGHMGSKMVKNFADDGHNILVFDQSQDAINAVVHANEKHVKEASVTFIAQNCQIIFSMLPNDNVVEAVSRHILESSSNQSEYNKKIHVSCSTISPEIAKKLTRWHEDRYYHFVSAPVFARPDGIARREAIFMLSGNKDAKATVNKYLQLLGRVEDFGEETGAANVVKLCGNFLIAVRFVCTYRYNFYLLQ